MPNEMISIVIPVYNSEKTIRQTLESVLFQTYKDIEIIIVNDGSTDNSINIIHDVINNNNMFTIKLINQENSGVSKARNNGIKHARGEYIALLDSDDKWDKNKLAKQVDIMRKVNELGLLGTRAYSSKRNKSKIYRNKISYINFNKLLLKNHIYTSSALLRREVIDSVGMFDGTQKYSEDFDLWLRVSTKYRVAILNKPLTFYNSDTTGLSSNLFKMQSGELISYKKLLKNNDINIVQYFFLSVYSNLKFIKRIVYKNFK